jgi:hypothetical protein
MRGGCRDVRLRWSARMAVAGVLVLVIPVAAAAHPFVADGGTVAVASLAPITLDLAHGCGDERSGAGLVTDEVALEVPTWLRIVEVGVADGWSSVIESAEGAEGAEAGAVVWSATAGGEPAPRFDLLVVIDGEAGETRYLRVSQRCGDVVERWIGTPEEPAERPAVRLRLLDADPASPPPPPAPAPSAPTPADRPAPEAPVAGGPSEATTAPKPTEASPEAPGGGIAPILATALLGAALVGAGVLVRSRCRRHPEPATAD